MNSVRKSKNARVKRLPLLKDYLVKIHEGSAIKQQILIAVKGGSTQWCKFMSKNLNFAREISRGGRGRTRVGGATKKREISLTS